VLAETIAYERNSSTRHRLTPSELAANEKELRTRTKDAGQKIKAAADGLQKRLAGETSSHPAKRGTGFSLCGFAFPATPPHPTYNR
jgi:hypothetical protein